MGKSSSQTQEVGNSYFANMAMAIGTKVDKYLELWIDNKKVSDLSDFSRDGYCMTGEKSSQYPSNAGKSKLKFYYGNNTIANDLLTKLTGYSIKYKNTAYIVFYDAFLGDNVRSAPNLKFKVRHTNILGWRLGSYQDGVLLDDINGEINPAVALYHMMTVLSKVPEELIDRDSFVKSAITLYDEQFGLSFNISTSEEAKKWASEICRIIDASLFFDITRGKYVLKLLRDDYDKNNLISLDDTNTKEVNYTKNTWANTATEVTLEYTSNINFESISINKTNTTTEILSKNRNNKVVQMMAITNDNVANNVLNRQLQKYTVPLANVSMKIPSNIHLRPLDVIKYSNNTLGINNMILRVLEIGADGYDREYYEIKCIEDIFALGEFDSTDVQQPIAEFDNYIINYSMNLVYDYVYLNKDISKYTNKPSILFLDNADDNSVVTYDTITHNNTTYTQQVENFSFLTQEISKDHKYFIDEIFVQRQNFMKEFTLSERDWQAGNTIIVINGEVLSIKSLEFIDENIVKISRLLRNINNTNIENNYEIGSRVWLLSSNFKTLEIDNSTYIENIDLDVKLNNRINVSNKFDVTIPYSDFYYKPYKVEFVKYENNILSWYPTYFEQYNSAATYSDPDLVVSSFATENVVQNDQSFRLEVTYIDNTTEIINTKSLSYELINLKNVNIYNIINNKDSDPVFFEVGN